MATAHQAQQSNYIVTHRTMPDVLSMDTHSRTSRDEEALQDVASLLMALRFYNDVRIVALPLSEHCIYLPCSPFVIM
ncbi:hypothetical protein D918_04981 [Trichuris suis]|nr:hypothetical protein D918_04981 [Trichuris suis]